MESVVIEEEKTLWFAMRATYQQELKLQKMLNEIGIESFVPMEYRSVTQGRRCVRRLVSRISNYIFIYTSQQRLREIKTRIPYLRYVVDINHNQIVVPEDQMRDFIRVSSAHSDDLLYLNPEEIDLKTGERVRVCGGVFDGVKGVLVKIAGRRNRRFVVSLDGVIAVAVTVDVDFVERV